MAHKSADVDVVLVSYNTADLTRKALTALAGSTGGPTLNVIVVDNASQDGSAAMLSAEFPGLTLIANQGNVGFGRANNQALPHCVGRYMLLLNTDAFVQPDSLAKTVAYMDAHPDCGILGVKLVGQDGALQPSCRYFPTNWSLFLNETGLRRVFPRVRYIDDMTWDHASARDCDWVPGCYYLIRREAVDRVGLFDPRYFLYYEEVDHCLAVKRAGYRVTFVPDTEVVHLGGESAKSEGPISEKGRQLEGLRLESELLYFRKNHGFGGMLLRFLLIVLANLAQIAKRLLGRGRAGDGRVLLRHIGLAWSTLWRTRWATRPTR